MIVYAQAGHVISNALVGHMIFKSLIGIWFSMLKSV